ncbi:unnamed protein product [Musa banksii]
MCRRKTRHSRRVAQRGLASRSPVTVKRQSTEERGTSFLRGNCGSENQRTSRMRLNKERNQCKYIQIRFCSSGLKTSIRKFALPNPQMERSIYAWGKLENK